MDISTWNDSLAQRWIRLLAMPVIAASLILCFVPAAALAKDVAVAARPTIVLVHGSLAGPSSWDEVVAWLQKDGYSTVTPTLGLASLDGDVAIVRAALDGISGDKILVAHSYGGFVISNAAAGRTDVLGLVFTAGFLPAPGETILGILEGYEPASFLAPGHLVFNPFPFATPRRSSGRTSRKT
jgi:pimeloyl-ACP methyl ester carboxylesterase